MTLPELYVTTPSCGHCYKDTHWDEGFVCDECRLYWPDLDRPAEFLDDGDARCEKEPKPHYEPEYIYEGKYWTLGPKQPCELPEGHTSGCLNDYDVTTRDLTDEEKGGPTG